MAVLAHHLPPDGHPDSFAIRLIAKILSDGESSRLHRSLVYEQGLAMSIESGGNLAEHPGLFYAMAVVQPGFTVEDALAALSNQLNRLIDVLKVVDVSSEECVRRELMLVKLRLTDSSRAELIEWVQAQEGRVLEASDPRWMICEFVGEHQVLESHLKSLSRYEILEVVRTGNAAMQKGKNVLIPFATEALS